MSQPASDRVIPEITTFQLLLEYLKLEGVEHLFGIPGASFKHLLTDLMLQRDTFEYVVCKHETGAGYAADGYYRVGGGLGVVLVTSGPGATNAITGAMNAQAGFSSMLTITGETSLAYLGMGWEQEGVDLSLNVEDMYRSAVSYTAHITSPANFQTLIHQALRDARGVPRQVSHISISDDVGSSTMKDVAMPASTERYRTTPAANDPTRTKRVLDDLLSAERPLIFLGNGCREVLRGGLRQPLIELSEKFGIPVMTTNDGKALFPESHDLSLRTYGVAACEWPKHYMQPADGAPHAKPYDCLLVLGSSMGNFSTNNWNPILNPKGPFIQVDGDQRNIARAMPVTYGVVAELGAFLTDLFELAAGREPDVASRDDRLAYIAGMKEQYSPWADPRARASDQEPIRPERAMAILSELLPEGGHIFVDAGNSCGFSSHYLEIDPPSQVHPALDVGAMGYAVGAVVGGKLAAGDQTCVAVCGDGGFMMHGAEVSTAHQYGLGAIWMVWDDNDLSMVSQGMDYYFPNPEWKDYYKLGKPDIVEYATGLGADAVRVSTPESLTEALKNAIAGGREGRPQVIAIRHDDSAMPPYYPPKKKS